MEKHVLSLIIPLTIALVACAPVTKENGQRDALDGYVASQAHSQGGADTLEEDAQYLPDDLLEPTVLAEPSVDMLTYHRDKTEHWNRLSMCMEVRGWPAPTVVNSYTAHVGLELDGWWGSRDRYVSDIKDCLTEAGPNPMPPAFTRELALKEYERAVAAHSCLIDLGAPLPEFPSQQKYVDDFVVNKSPWSPLEHLMPDDYPQDLTLEQLYERCPW